MNREIILKHQNAIEEFEKTRIKAEEPLPIALVHKLGDLSDGVETNHSKYI